MTAKRANQLWRSESPEPNRPRSRESGSAKAPPGFDVLRTGVLLRRYLFVHLGFVRALAGWLIATPRYEDKYVFGYHLWDHARHGLAISNRLKDLRGGLAEPSIDPDLRRVVEELVHAHDTSEFIAGAYLELVASLANAYHTHLEVADPSANAPEIQLIRVIAVDLEAHLKWANERLSEVPLKCTTRSPSEKYPTQLRSSLNVSRKVSGKIQQRLESV